MPSQADVRQADLKQVRIVLVGCLYGGNIGRVVRAMKNMGLSDIALVRPQEFPSKEAEIFAASAADMLKDIKVYDDLDAALADRDLVVATSSRSRRLPIETHPVRAGAMKICEQLLKSDQAEQGAEPPAEQRAGDESANEEYQASQDESRPASRIAILFGSEDKGLTNDELLKSRMHLFIPTSNHYPVLNLAMAVQIVCYELFCAVDQLSGRAMDYPLRDGKVNTSNRLALQKAIPLADNDTMESFYGHLESWLTKIDFFNPQKPQTIMRKMRRIFNRVALYANEVDMLRGMITRSIRHIDRSATKPELKPELKPDLKVSVAKAAAKGKIKSPESSKPLTS